MIRCIVIGVAGALLAAGCTSGETTAAPTIRSGADIRLPLDEYLLTDQQIQLISSAHTVLGRRCLARLGLTWPDPGPSSPATDEPRNARRYYVLDLEEVRIRGYRSGLPQRPPDDGDKPDPEAVAAWTREDGCAVKTSRVLDVGTAGVDPQILQLETFSRMQTDPRVREANARWSGCMREAGYDYPDPAAADGDPRWARSTAATSDEIATATADVLCKHSTRLPDVMFAVETGYQQQAVTQHQADLVELHAAHQAVLETATRIVGKQGL